MELVAPEPASILDAVAQDRIYTPQLWHRRTPHFDLGAHSAFAPTRGRRFQQRDDGIRRLAWWLRGRTSSDARRACTRGGGHELEQQLGPPSKRLGARVKYGRSAILDSEAVNALARPTARRVLAERAAAVSRVAHEKRALIRVPAPVLAEVCRGVRYDRAAAEQAGRMLARLKLSSAHAFDAFVVATALQFDTAVIATGDGDDIRGSGANAVGSGREG